MVNSEHSLTTQHSSLEVFTTFDSNHSMDEIDEHEKSNRNIETRKQTQQPKSRTKKLTISNERRYYIWFNAVLQKTIIFYYYSCKPVLGLPKQNSLSNVYN